MISGVISGVISGANSGVISGVTSGVISGVNSGVISAVNSGVNSGVISGVTSEEGRIFVRPKGRRAAAPQRCVRCGVQGPAKTEFARVTSFLFWRTSFRDSTVFRFDRFPRKLKRQLHRPPHVAQCRASNDAGFFVAGGDDFGDTLRIEGGSACPHGREPRIHRLRQLAFACHAA